MTREEVNNLALSTIDRAKFLILELATGYGKSKLAIDLINHICDRVYELHQDTTNVLILVAKKVHKKNWLDEIEKWGGLKTDNVIIECYESFHKYKNAYFDITVGDEVQHLSPKRLEILDTIHIKEAFIGLSATIKKDMKDYFTYKYNAEIIKCSLKEAIEEDILPEPKVYLLPLSLDNNKYEYKLTRFGRTSVLTQVGYNDAITTLIEYYKRKFYTTKNIRTKNLWLSTAGKRLKWLSEQKESIVLSILRRFSNYRTLTFCSSIDQSERLGKYNITSKNKKAIEYLNMFNNLEIKHITACSILNEGANLTNCRIGIFCNLNSSEIITRQRIGRLLRHSSPIIIIPYYKNTREEELVTKMLEEYNRESIVKVHSVNEIII